MLPVSDMKTLADVYEEKLNFHPQVVVTKHCAQRIIERKIPVEDFVAALRERLIPHRCTLLFDLVLSGHHSIKVRHNGITIPVSFLFEKHKFIIKTVY